MITTTTDHRGRVVLAIDAGGTCFKSALIEAGPAVVAGSFYQVPSGNGQDRGEVVAAYVQTIRHALDGAAANGQTLTGIGVSTPGPFDYRAGVYLMKHKFVGLYGVNIVDALRAAIPEIVGVPIRFRHDANSFLAGEMWNGAARGAVRAGGVTLGTGIGVSCRIDGEFRNNELGSPAPEVSLWNTPYRDGIVEDYVSSRALVAAYRQLQPDYDPAEGAKGIAAAAAQGDGDARDIYAGLGRDLGRILQPWCERFQPEVIVFGGQIAQSFALFSGSLEQTLQPATGQPRLVPGQLGQEAALYGVAKI